MVGGGIVVACKLAGAGWVVGTSVAEVVTGGVVVTVTTEVSIVVVDGVVVVVVVRLAGSTVLGAMVVPMVELGETVVVLEPLRPKFAALSVKFERSMLKSKP